MIFHPYYQFTSPASGPTGPEVDEYAYTIMRLSQINLAVEALQDSVAVAGGTMADTLNLATIMRASAINVAGAMSAASINREADLQ